MCAREWVYILEKMLPCDHDAIWSCLEQLRQDSLTHLLWGFAVKMPKGRKKRKAPGTSAVVDKKKGNFIVCFRLGKY